MRLLALLCLLLPTVYGAVSGTVTNGTTGKPQAGVTVTLTKLGQGMDLVGTATADASGRFSFPNEVTGPTLLQAQYEGVNYNKVLPPGSPTTDVALSVFATSKTPGNAQVLQHMLLLEPIKGQLLVRETIIYQNEGKTTYNDPENGTAKLYIEGKPASEVTATITAPQGMPIKRPVTPTKQPHVYGVNYAIKPGGTTQFDFSYTLPATTPLIFKGKVLHKEGRTLLAAPNGVTLTSEQLAPRGKEPRTQASIYEVQGDTYQIAIAGTGSLPESPAQPEQPGQPEESSGPPIVPAQPRIYDQRNVLLALTLLILACGFALLYRAQRG